MARKTTDTVYNLDLPIQAAHLATLLGMVEDPTLTDAQKIGGMALRLLQDQADGGLMLRPDEVKHITEATGIDPSCGEDLMPFLSEGAGREDGCLKVSVLIDPTYEEAYAEIAKFQERSVHALFQETMDMALANEWAYTVVPQPRHVLMSEENAQALEELLGGKFTTGTGLAELLKNALGAGGLFSEPAAGEQEHAAA